MKQKAFTLIELLVVIAIIGVISSIIFVNLSGAREKANIASALQFSQSLNHALGSEAGGVWNFENNTNDLSGNNNNGTLPNGGSFTDSMIYSGGNMGRAVELNGVNQYVNVSNSNSLNFGGSEVTMEAWLYPHNPTAGYTMFIRKQTPGYDFWLLPNGKLEAEIYHPNWVTEGYTSVYGRKVLQLNQWYHVVATYKQNQYFKIYINGKEDGSTVAPNKEVGTSSSSLCIGCAGWMGSGNAYFDGLIDGVRIYSRSLLSQEIQKNYAEGLEKHKIAEK